MNTIELAKVLEWVAKETEFVFAADAINDAAGLIKSLAAQLAASQRRERAAAEEESR